jgi:hypothetical protein
MFHILTIGAARAAATMARFPLCVLPFIAWPQTPALIRRFIAGL